MAAPIACSLRLQAKGKSRGDFVDKAIRPSCARRWSLHRNSCGSRRPAIPCCGWSIFGAVCDAAHAVGALAAVEIHSYARLWQQPFSLGADFVIHSTTKTSRPQRCGGGAAIAATAEAAARVWLVANAIGVTGAPFDSFLTWAGVRSLHARMRVHAENTAHVVEFLNAASGSAARSTPRAQQQSGPRDRLPPTKRLRCDVEFSSSPAENRPSAHSSPGCSASPWPNPLGGVESLIAHLRA